MTRLLLLRHAQSEWNVQGRWQGLADSPLSSLGRQQAVTAGRLLEPFGITALVSSDLERARVTAALVAEELGLPAPKIDDCLREYDVGAWSGLTRSEIEARWPGQIAAWREGRLAATPGGEQRVGSVARMAAAVARLAAEQPAETLLVITHGGVLGALAQSLGGEPRRVPHLAGRWFEAGRDGLAVGDPVDLLDSEGDASPSRVLDTGHR